MKKIELSENEVNILMSFYESEIIKYQQRLDDVKRIISLLKKPVSNEISIEETQNVPVQQAEIAEQPVIIPRKRGRKPKNQQSEILPVIQTPSEPVVKRRGRKPGSKNLKTLQREQSAGGIKVVKTKIIGDEKTVDNQQSSGKRRVYIRNIDATNLISQSKAAKNKSAKNKQDMPAIVADEQLKKEIVFTEEIPSNFKIEKKKEYIEPPTFYNRPEIIENKSTEMQDITLENSEDSNISETDANKSMQNQIGNIEIFNWAQFVLGTLINIKETLTIDDFVDQARTENIIEKADRPKAIREITDTLNGMVYKMGLIKRQIIKGSQIYAFGLPEWVTPEGKFEKRFWNHIE